MASEKLTFTRKALEALPAPAKRQIVHDAETRALVLEITPTGTKTFRLYRKVEGRPEKITLGRFNPKLPDSREFTQGMDLLKVLLTKPELNVKMARRLAEAVNVQLDSGRNVAETKREARGELTFGQLFDRYITDHCEPHKVRGIDKMREFFERYLGDLPDRPVKKHGVKRTKPTYAVNWQNRKISTITPAEVRRLHAAAGRELAGATANKILDLVGRLFTKAIDWKEFAGTSPAAGIEAFTEHSRERFLRPGELPKFWEALDSEASQDFKDFVQLSLLAGARSSNTASMEWAEIDFDSAEWRIGGHKSKNGKALTVVLAPEAMEILQRRFDAREAGCPWVFPADSKSGHMVNPRKRWVALLARAGLADLNIHDLRRSLGSWQARTGASLLVIGKSLGHQSPQATAIYARLDIDPVRESVERAATAIVNTARNGGGATVKQLPAKRSKSA